MLSASIRFLNIVKRNGKLEKFDKNKIVIAIRKAGEATGEFNDNTSVKLTDRVLNIIISLNISSQINVEDIQDIVESVLIDSPFIKTAKAYIIYRKQHQQIREITSKSNLDLVDKYLGKTDWKVKENSNMAFSLQGLNQYVSSEISKCYWLDKIYPENVKNAHNEGNIHIHDLSMLSVYCVGWDLYDLLVNGFQGVSGKMESKPAKHLRSALGQIVNFFYTLQGEAAGAQAFSNFDTLLAPFIRYDNLSYSQIKQALQEFVFNLNVPTRVGFQTPFTNITMDLICPSHFAEQGVVIGGELKKEVYKDFQGEMDLINRAYLEVIKEGDAKGRVFTFPIPTYNITSEFNWENKNLDLLWEITSKYGTPYFSNFVNSDMDPEDARSMCCRLRLDNRELKKRGGGLFGASPLTGSIGVVTVNLPRIGGIAKNREMFFELLAKNMLLAKDSLEIKRKVLEKYTDGNLYPYMKFYLRNVKKNTNTYWKNHFNTIGVVGMNEACINFFQRDISSYQGKEFAMEILDFMRGKLRDFQEETGNLYNLEATPAEGVSYRLAELDKKKFPNMACANEKQYKWNNVEPFYTNSTHLPVNYSDDIFAVLEHQDGLQTKYTGGTVLHFFIGESISDVVALKGLIKTVCINYKLPYFTITPTFSVCPKCGYLSGEHKYCFKCESLCEIYSRVCGYLRPVQQWNNGKKAEFGFRKYFKIQGKTVTSDDKRHV